jgi:3-oxoacyl-[acyl-carrier protein] reductase
MANFLQDKVAVITGAGGGLGGAIAQAFAQAGARLVLVGRNLKTLQETQLKLSQAGCQALCLPLDLTRDDSPTVLERTVQAHFGRWDVLVNCAGAFFYTPLAQVSLAQWEESLAVNLTAPFRLTQAILAHVTAHRSSGCVINIGSVHGAVGDALAVPQCASKFGLVGLTRATAEACRTSGLRINAISPGAIVPQSAQRLSEVGDGAQVTQADVAQLAVYLASDMAHFVNGAVIDAFGHSRPVLATGAPPAGVGPPTNTAPITATATATASTAVKAPATATELNSASVLTAAPSPTTASDSLWPADVAP